MLDGADDALMRFLLKHGCIDASVSAAVEEYARSHRLPVIEALCDGGFLDEAVIANTFHTVLRLPRVDLRNGSAHVAEPIDLDTLKMHLAAPVEVANGRLVLAMANPLDHEALRKVAFTTGLRVVPAVGLLDDIRGALSRESPPPPAAAPIAPEAPARVERLSTLIQERRAEPVGNSPIVKMAALLIEQALTLRASDIHLEPTPEGLTVRYRIDGVLEEATRLSPAVRSPLVARLKVMAALDIAERRVPQDGGLSIAVNGRAIDCRVSTLPTQYGEKVVIRILDAQRALVQLDQLGFEPDELARVREALRQSEGMILTTGPTGSGKTTTLYAMLQAVLSPEVNIVTVENPIEYRLAGVNQTEVHERQGMTFAAALRSILRQDPDVILVGEIRDRETAEIAVQAAQTGHLVLSTLHTNDSIGAVTRLAKLGIDRELIASTLLLVIAQRLLRRNCPRCTAPAADDAGAALPFRSAFGDGPLQRGRGCRDCRDTGYRGRVGVYEIFRNTQEAKRLISAGAGEVELRDLMRRQGGRSLMQTAIEKVRHGHTTPDEIVQVIKPDEGQRLCPGCGAMIDQHFHACPECGTALRRTCTSCHAPLLEGQDACAACGAAPGPVHAKPAAAPEPTTTAVELVASKALAVGSLLGAGVRGLCTAGGLDDVAAAELELAVVETCGLACTAGIDGTVRIAIELSPDGCSVCVSDDGAPWPWPRPNARPPDLEAFAEESQPEVRAFLIRSSVDEASYERGEHGNRLWLIKRPSTERDAGERYAAHEQTALAH
jgi:type II secretory ATPase GspE/PulE/Tfp pilus assembly ATPase PilB-like protein/anti-sigma regulatory factor (Ser/Thr protein kinase)